MVSGQMITTGDTWKNQSKSQDRDQSQCMGQDQVQDLNQGYG